jgi:cysteinyl-tRNA synthetase
MDFTREELDDAKKGYMRLVETIRAVRDAARSGEGDPGVEGLLNASAEQAKKKFLEAMDDDFNTREAIGALFELSREVNKILTSSKVGSAALRSVVEVFDIAAQVLGLFEERAVGGEGDLDDVMSLMIEVREEARKKKDFEMSDWIRDELGKIGLVLEDTKTGIKWKKG